MDTLHVGRLRARYRLPAGEGARARLDQVLRAVVDGALEEALAQAGVPAHEEVCLRTVSAPARLRLREPDSALAGAWGGALARAIRATLDAGGPGVVRYSSRAHAVVDLLCGVARGDLRRAWAWRQLGLWGAGDAPSAERSADEAARVLVSHPEHAVAALAEAARAGALPALAARIRPSAWLAIVRAALAASAVSGTTAGALVARIEPAAAPGDSPADPPAASSPGLPIPPHARSAERIARASAIIRAVSFLSHSPRTRAALAVLGALEVDATALRRTAEQAIAVVASVEREMEDAAAAVHPAGDAERRDARRPRASEGRRGDGDRAASIDSRSSTDRAASIDRAAAEDGHAAKTAALADGDAAGAIEIIPGEGVESIAAGESPEDEEGPRAVRRVGETRWGGLLFLVHVVDALGLVEGMMADPALASRPLRWSLHRLALELLALDERDPAALAFAGLGPDGDPPSRGEPSATEEEAATIVRLARRVSDGLHLRVRGEPAPGRRAADALLREVCRRAATIEADPGWIEVRLGLDEVSVAVRRAGLDLDPGWVPWLGAVVRFVYG